MGKKTEPGREPTHIVGIGASAGGLEAIEGFFKNIPLETGLAYIVVQHLSPDYKSLMVELLSKKTPLRVVQAQEGMAVERDTVYLIPPKKTLTVFQRKILLKTLTPTGGVNLPIDDFFISLAEEESDRAIAMVLSGTGSDGTRGIRAIKEKNGIVMVQDGESAKFDGMPRSALSTGLVDFSLPPRQMAEQLLSYVKHPFGTRSDRDDGLINDKDVMSRIFGELRKRSMVDFSQYKKNTIIRRMERRMAISNSPDAGEYFKYMQRNPEEADILFRELLIGVTSFFRDPDIMDELMEVHLPDLIRSSEHKELRFWTAGCSTGEEAYTLAIMAKEAMEKLGVSRDIKIFATDIDKEAIQKAGVGEYPESIAADLNVKLLSKYFYKREGRYQIVRNIREMVVFAQHNLIKDPPFTNIDLISCRNLLIYLQPVLQKKVMDMFGFSLNEKGLLVLGSSESVGDRTDRFEPVNPQKKIFRSAEKNGRKSIGIVTGSHREREPLDPSVRQRATMVQSGEINLYVSYIKLLSRQYFRLSVIVNSDLEVLHTFGDAQGIFRIPEGPPHYEIHRLAVKEIAIPLSTGIQKAFRDHEEVIYSNICLPGLGEEPPLRLRIVPLEKMKGRESMAVVFFEAISDGFVPKGARETGGYDIQAEVMQRINDLETELQFTKENLQATIEELETSNEELQATNEELLASNEELQSTNEELQSTNEELYTVNNEYQSKISELTELNNDVENLLSSSHIGKLILDEEMRIRRFSPEIAKIFSIIDKDMGRPITHLNHNIKDFDLIGAINRVMEKGTLLEEKVNLIDSTRYLLRILPYNISPEVFSGVVLTFVDITDALATQDRLDRLRETNSEILDFIPSGLFIYGHRGEGRLVLESCNPEAERIIGRKEADVIGRDFDELWPNAASLGFSEKVKEVLKRGEHYRGLVEYKDETVNGIYRIQVFPLPEDRLALSFEDVSSLSELETRLRRESHRYQFLFNEMDQGVVYQEADGQISRANPAAERILGLTLSQMQGRTSMDERWRAVRVDGSPLTGEDHPAMVCLRTGEPVIDFVMGVFNPKLDELRWIRVNAKPLFEQDDSKPSQVFTTFDDITDKRERSFSDRHHRERLEIAFDSSQIAWWDYDVSTSKVVTSPLKGRMLGYDDIDDEMDLDFWTGLIHPDDYDRAMDAMRDHLEGKISHYEIVYRLRSKTGRYVKLLDRGRVASYDEEGKPLRVIGAVARTEL